MMSVRKADGVELQSAILVEVQFATTLLLEEVKRIVVDWLSPRSLKEYSKTFWTRVSDNLELSLISREALEAVPNDGLYGSTSSMIVLQTTTVVIDLPVIKAILLRFFGLEAGSVTVKGDELTLLVEVVGVQMQHFPLVHEEKAKIEYGKMATAVREQLTERKRVEVTDILPGLQTLAEAKLAERTDRTDASNLVSQLRTYGDHITD